MAEAHSLQVAAIRRLTDEAVAVSFAVPDALADAYKYRAGQYLGVSREFDGEQVKRCYSICCAESAGRLRIGVKHVPEGRFSGFINTQLQVGDSLMVDTPEGDFGLPDDGDNYLFVAAGSGITPVLAMLQTALERRPDTCATLVYGNRTAFTMMFADELRALKNRFMHRFNWINIYSRQNSAVPLFNGRIDNRKGAELHRHLIPMDSFQHYFLCGPEPMIAAVSRGLAGLGIGEASISHELFASSGDYERAVMEGSERRAREHAGEVSQVVLRHGGREYAFDLAADGTNILDAGLSQGANLPFSCKAGVCSTCKCKLVEGKVDMDVQQALQDGEAESGWVLSCQAHPLSQKVTLDFDAST